MVAALLVWARACVGHVLLLVGGATAAANCGWAGAGFEPLLRAAVFDFEILKFDFEIKTGTQCALRGAAAKFLAQQGTACRSGTGADIETCRYHMHRPPYPQTHTNSVHCCTGPLALTDKAPTPALWETACAVGMQEQHDKTHVLV